MERGLNSVTHKQQQTRLETSRFMTTSSISDIPTSKQILGRTKSKT